MATLYNFPLFTTSSITSAPATIGSRSKFHPFQQLSCPYGIFARDWVKLEDGTASAFNPDDGRRRLSGLSSRRVAVVFAAAAADAARPPRPRFRLGPLLLLLGQAARPAPPLGQAGDDGLDRGYSVMS